MKSWLKGGLVFGVISVIIFEIIIRNSKGLEILWALGFFVVFFLTGALIFGISSLIKKRRGRIGSGLLGLIIGAGLYVPVSFIYFWVLGWGCGWGSSAWYCGGIRPILAMILFFVLHLILGFIIVGSIIWIIKKIKFSLIENKEQIKSKTIAVVQQSNQQTKQQTQKASILSKKSWFKWGFWFSLISTLFNILWIILGSFQVIDFSESVIAAGIIIVLSIIFNIVPLYLIGIFGNLGTVFYEGMYWIISPKIPGIILTTLFWFGVGVLVGHIINKIKSKEKIINFSCQGRVNFKLTKWKVIGSIIVGVIGFLFLRVGKYRYVNPIWILIIFMISYVIWSLFQKK